MKRKIRAVTVLAGCTAMVLVACESTTEPPESGRPRSLWTHRDEAGARGQPFADGELAVFTSLFARRVVALDAASGTVRWRRELPAVLPGRNLPIGNVLAYRDLLLVPGWDLFALDRKTGALRWQFAPDDEYPAGSFLVLEGERVYSSGGHKRFYAVDARTGTLLWRTDLNERPFGSVVENGVVYVGTRGYIDDITLGAGHALALDANDGRVLWRVPLPDAPDSPWQGGAVQRGALTSELFIIASTNGRVYGIERTSGRVRWEYHGSAPYQAGVGVLDGVAVVAALDGSIDGLDVKTGERLWRSSTGGSSVTDQIITDGKCAYVTVGAVLCVDATGKVHWDIGGWSNGGPSYSTPVRTAGGRIFAGSTEGFHALRQP